MCVCAVVGGVGCDGVAVERAQNLTSEKYPGGCKADETVTHHPCGASWWWSFWLSWGASEYCPSALPDSGPKSRDSESVILVIPKARFQ